MSWRRLPLVRLLVLLSLTIGLAVLSFESRGTASASNYSVLATATRTAKSMATAQTGQPNPGGRVAPIAEATEPPTSGAPVPEIPKTGFGGTAKSGVTLPATGGAAGDSSNPLVPLTLFGLALIAVGRLIRRYLRG